MHETAQLELDPPTDRQPMQLKEARRDMLASTQLENQSSIGVLCTRCNGAIVASGKPASTELQYSLDIISAKTRWVATSLPTRHPSNITKCQQLIIVWRSQHYTTVEVHRRLLGLCAILKYVSTELVNVHIFFIEVGLCALKFTRLCNLKYF